MNSNQLIEEYVRRNNTEYSENQTYSKCIEEMRRIDFRTVTEQDVNRVIERFLTEWGRMQRHLGKGKARGWQDNVANEIRLNSQKLNDYRTKDLTNVELMDSKSDIEDFYEAFTKALAGTEVGAAKVLHLICPHFFPPWDNAIRDAIRNEETTIRVNTPPIKLTGEYYQEHAKEIEDFINKYRGKKRRKPKRFSSVDYYKFMQQIQVFIRTYEDVLSNLASEYKKSKVKIVDDFLWYLTQRPLLFLSFLELA